MNQMADISSIESRRERVRYLDLIIDTESIKMNIKQDIGVIIDRCEAEVHYRWAAVFDWVLSTSLDTLQKNREWASPCRSWSYYSKSQQLGL